MESGGTNWGARGGVSLGHVDNSHYWQPGSSGEVIYEPISPHLTATAPGYGGNPNIGAPALPHPPPPSNSEPPYKKSRSDAYSDAPPGSGHGGFSTPALLQPPGLAATDGILSSSSKSYGGFSAPAYEDPLGQNYDYSAATPDVENYGGYASQEGQKQSGAAFQHRSFGGGSGGGGGGRGRGLSSLFYKTKLCNNYKSGICTFNENCSFAHGAEELRKPPPSWQQMMSSAGNSGPGGRGGGGIVGGSSGQNEQRSFRGRICKFFVQGNCPYGDRCSFSHGNEEEQKNSGAGDAGTRRSTRSSRWEKEPQSYSGSSSFKSNGVSGGTLTSIYQQLDMKHNMPATYGANQPGSSVPARNFNVNHNPGTIGQPSLGLQDPSGASANIGYWDQGKKWDNASDPVGQTTAYMETYAQQNQNYDQSNQTGSWMPGYSTDQFSRNDADGETNHYPNQQQQTAPFFRGGAPQYAILAQDLSSEYGQDDYPNEY